MSLSAGVQKNIATFTTAGAIKARTGDKLFGNHRGIADEMQQCVCGVCVRTQNTPRTTCMLQADEGMRVVERTQTELCKTVRVSKSPLGMLMKLLRNLLRSVASMFPTHVRPDDAYIRVSLQRDDANYQVDEHESQKPQLTTPYIFDAMLSDGELDLAFFTTLDELKNRRLVSVPYRIGDPIDFAGALDPRVVDRLKQLTKRALIEGDGEKYSLLVQCAELPSQDFDINGIAFRNIYFGVFKARPLFLFIQAHPSTDNLRNMTQRPLRAAEEGRS